MAEVHGGGPDPEAPSIERGQQNILHNTATITTKHILVIYTTQHIQTIHTTPHILVMATITAQHILATATITTQHLLVIWGLPGWRRCTVADLIRGHHHFN